ncbi:protein tincar [Ditylenchus destructor]|uniref:Protein tincar n=1 Tax=Ditylenchus destructor TaxID=166010 RepID=A0AAD4N2B7_9BILA|nr:protein tincar [Ditylenchus destructor]
MSGCVFRVRLNNLGSIWYTILSTLVQLYLLYLGLERYRLYTDLKWPHGSYPREWLTAYVSLLAICIPLLVLFMAFGVFKSGNLAGDNELLGARPERIIELSRGGGRNVRRRGGPCFLLCHSIKSVWQHSAPLPQSIHLTLALCQLLAQQLMLAQLYRFGFINSGDFLNTELDFVYQRARQLATNLPMGDTRLQGFRITSEELADSPMAPNLLPILMHARLFGIPLEFVNFLVALVAFSCVYPAVFWRLSKPFSMCFSLHLLIHTVTVIWSYLSFSILFRVQETNYYSSRPVGIGQHLWSLRPLLLYHPLAVLACFVITLFLMHISPVALYAYGYNKYLQSVYMFRRSRGPPSTAMNGNNGVINGSSMPGTPSSAAIGRFTNENCRPPAMCCDGYGPHISAIFILIAIVAAKSSTLYALTLLYQHEDKPLILSCIVVDVVYLFTWILCWLFLTLKREWNFRVIHEVREILSLQEAQRTADGNIRNKSITDLKNSLLLMHKGHLFVTDDPVAKPAIMRHVLKSCVQDDIYWLRGNQSPANRKIPLEDRATEMGHLLDASSPGTQNCNHNEILAAPPYSARLSSLPPIGTPINAQNNSGNSFGTLQRGMRNEYGSRMMGSPYQSSVGRSSLQSSYNPIHPEAYATIHRSTNRSALSSLSRGGAGEYGIVGLGPTVSPQMMRQNHQSTRGSTTSNGSREVMIGGPPTSNGNNQIYGQIYDSRNSQSRSGPNSMNRIPVNSQSANQYGQYGNGASQPQGLHSQSNYDGIAEIRQGRTPLMINSVQMSPNTERKWKRDSRSATREISAQQNNAIDRLPRFNNAEPSNGPSSNQHPDNSLENRIGDSKMQRQAITVNAAKKPPMPSLSQLSATMPKTMLNSNGQQVDAVSPTPSSSAAASVSSNVTSSLHADNSTGIPTPTLDQPVNGEYQTNTLKPAPNPATGTKPQISPKPLYGGNAVGQNFIYQNGYRSNQINGNQWKPNSEIYDSRRRADDPKQMDEFATSVV